MKVTLLSKKRMLLEFLTQKELTLSMFRFSEFAEGENGVKGCRFTFDVFVDKYSDADGNLNYFSFWDGFNVKMSDINKFSGLCKYSDLSQRERSIIKATADFPKDGYVIACVEGDKTVLRHELAHAKFYDNEDYRSDVLDIVSGLNKSLRQKYSDSLKELHYTDDLIDDEIHAYLVAYDRKEYQEIFPNIDYREIEPYIEMLNILFSKYE